MLGCNGWRCVVGGWVVAGGWRWVVGGTGWRRVALGRSWAVASVWWCWLELDDGKSCVGVLGWGWALLGGVGMSCGGTRQTPWLPNDAKPHADQSSTLGGIGRQCRQLKGAACV